MALLHCHNFFFFGSEQVINFLDVFVVHFLNFSFGIFLQVFRESFFLSLFQFIYSIAASVSLPAARGDILDCNGVRLSGDRVGVQVTVNGFSREQAAELLTQLGETVTMRGDVVCEDVSEKTAAILRENPEVYAGLETAFVPIRTYEAGEVAAHILGTVGPVYAEEYETLKEKGYRLTDRVGKSGIEAALQRTPGYMQERGCGYCLRLASEQTEAAVTILKRNALRYSNVYPDGEV